MKLWETICDLTVLWQVNKEFYQKNHLIQKEVKDDSKFHNSVMTCPLQPAQKKLKLMISKVPI